MRHEISCELSRKYPLARVAIYYRRSLVSVYSAVSAIDAARISRARVRMSSSILLARSSSRVAAPHALFSAFWANTRT